MLHTDDTGVYGGWNDDGSGSDFEDEDANGKSLYSSSRGGVSFVASAGPSRPAEAQDEESEEEDSDDAMDESEEEPIQPNISMEEDEDEEEDSRPRLGLGSQQPLANQFPTQFTSTNASVQRGANSSKRPSLGATSKAPTWKAPAKDFAKFEKHTKGIGSKLLSKMGYVPGQGLGADGSGIVEPIDVRQRPQKMGLGHGGFDERTDSARKEQEAKKTQKTQKERAAMDAPAWKKGFVDDEDREKGRQFKRRPKKTYVSAADLVADSLGAEEVPSGVKETKILDLTGPQARVLDNISQISNRGATAIGGGNDYLKELKYNLGILADTYQAELLRSARAMGDLKKRQRITKAELANVNDKNSKDAKLLADLERLSILLKEIQLLKKGIASSAIPTWVSTKSAFKDAFSRLKTESTSLKDEQMGGGNLMGLDTIVVAAVAPALKALFQRWEVLEEPDLGVQVLSEWIPLLDPQGILSPVGVTNQRPMTPYENLLYSFWLPRVRQAITCVILLFLNAIRSIAHFIII